MKFAVNDISVLPIRFEPKESSELVSQLLFGELYIIDKIVDNWAKIQVEHDAYVGWVDKKMLNVVSEEDYKCLLDSPYCRLDERFAILINENNQELLISMGSRIPKLTPNIDYFVLGARKYSLRNEISVNQKGIIEIAFKFLNTPYLWGGRNIMGIDCSGFTQLVFQICGVSINRDASQQEKQGELVGDLTKYKEADLAFFVNDKLRVIHVGILLGGNRIIHASGKVRVDDIDEKGIINNETGLYTHRLSTVKRYI
ncbi:MAG: C40 family peptidase [Marinifilaceae bacterium]|jgi:cell wall-associated NlpC family hydrolase|nr:C40 family peptidase [Marinifilaceae bacterium]